MRLLNQKLKESERDNTQAADLEATRQTEQRGTVFSLIEATTSITVNPRFSPYARLSPP